MPLSHLIFGGMVIYLFLMETYTGRNVKNEATLSHAIAWSIVYVVMALAFALLLFVQQGTVTAQRFLTAYMLEKVLSVDNLMVFAAIFSYFGVESPRARRKILHWGIIGAVVARLVFTIVGVHFLNSFGKWTEGAFSVIVAASAINLFRDVSKEPVDHNKRWYVRWTRKVFRVATGLNPGNEFVGRRMFIQPKGDIVMKRQNYVTPLFLCLIAIEVSDIAFAFDSVPTVIAVARDPFIIYSAMVFAILGLRNLYFLLGHLIKVLRYVSPAVGCILVYVALKLALHGTIGLEIKPAWNLIVISSILGVGVIASLCSRGIPSEGGA